MDDPRSQWQTLATALDRTMKAHAPGWTDHNQHDPGITLLEVMAFLAEGLPLFVTASTPGTAVSRTIRALRAFRPSRAGAEVVHEHWSGVSRPRFFSGRMLTADDLSEEQEYHRERHRRHLRMLHGVGVVSGLDVGPGDDTHTIHVSPGYALDADGREVSLRDRATLMVPADCPSPLFVVIEYAERLVRHVPSPSGDGTEPSRIEEGCTLVLSASCDTGVQIARLVRESHGWHVDRSFAPVRVPAPERSDR